MKIILPNTIKKLIEIFKINNFKCFVVGGAIRDYLSKTTPKEFDLCTNATPSIIKFLFKNNIPTGEEYGCIKVLFYGTWFEITTFRVESCYKDFRHAEFIKFVSTPLLDAQRRDFTMNSIYFDGENFIDPFNGVTDIENRVIRVIGNKSLRFKEDPLRILRALKFKSKLGFNIEEDTFYYLKRDFDLIRHLSKHRIIGEMREIFKGNNSLNAFKIFNDLKGFNILFNREISFSNFKEVFSYNLEFHIFLFSLLYFHSSLDKDLILDILKQQVDLSKTELKELSLVLEVLENKNINLNRFYIKQLIFKYDYSLSFKILKLISIYILKSDRILKLFYEIKWGYSPIKFSHLNIDIQKLKLKKNITKHKKRLVTIIHLKPKLNKKRILNHLLKTKL